MQQDNSLIMAHVIMLIGLFFITSCEPLAHEADNIESLDVVLLGTYGYTTVEQLGKTIEDYDSTMAYDETRLPDIQVGFPLELPITFFNQGQQAWYDFQAQLDVIITDPFGNETRMLLPINKARVTRQRTDGIDWYFVKEKANAFERRLVSGDHRVFFFQTEYMPTMPGVYTLLLELRSKGHGVTRVTKSGFTIHVLDATSGVTTAPTVCSLYQSCSASERCCSKGSDISLEQRQGHCAAVCSSEEVEIVFSVIPIS